ncbi:hypothetical protein HN51_056123, partial [Arachis hypogaea]
MFGSLVAEEGKMKKRSMNQKQDNDVYARYFIRNSMFDILFLYQRCTCLCLSFWSLLLLSSSGFKNSNTRIL